MYVTPNLCQRSQYLCALQRSQDTESHSNLLWDTMLPQICVKGVSIYLQRSKYTKSHFNFIVGHNVCYPKSVSKESISVCKGVSIQRVILTYCGAPQCMLPQICAKGVNIYLQKSTYTESHSYLLWVAPQCLSPQICVKGVNIFLQRSKSTESQSNLL